MKNSVKQLIVACTVVGFLMFGCEIDDIHDDLDPVEKFLGKWKCEESSVVYGDGYNYDVEITRNPQNSYEILIANFYFQGMQEQAVALITGNVLTIPKQIICEEEGGIEIKGNGIYENGEINLEHTAFTGADMDTVIAKYYRD